MTAFVDKPDTPVPPECELLREAHKRSGVSIPDLAVSSGLSPALIHIALSGVRYRDGAARHVRPTDKTLVRLAYVLGVSPEELTARDRTRAALLLTEILKESGREVQSTPTDRETRAALSARAAVLQQIVTVFTDEELRAELDRREEEAKAAFDAEARAEIVADLKAELGVL